MRSFDLKCPNCTEIALDSKNKLIFCNNCGYAPNGQATRKCPICNNYNYSGNDELNSCNTCNWRFDRSEISKDEYRTNWEQKQQNYSKIIGVIRNKIEDYFSINGIKYNGQTFEDLVIGLFNYLYKATLSQKYTVSLSSEIITQGNHAQLVQLFKEKFENGENILPWQSRTTEDATYQDILFNNWNIKHLHLVADSSKRSEDILLYIQDDNNVYFLDVVKHPKGSGWNNFKFLKIVSNNGWMKQIGFIKISDFDPDFIEGSMEPKITCEKDIRELYKNNINMPFEIDGISYISCPGVVSTGERQEAVSYYIDLNKKIKNISSYEFLNFKPDFHTCLGEITYKKNDKEFTEQL
jgi:hypothetical protein